MTRLTRDFPKLLVLLAGLTVAGQSSAATATFSGFTDANPGLFDIATTLPDGGDPNLLNIGLSAFSAGGAIISALDTLNLVITAPAGYRITKITYSESGSASAPGATDVAVATGSVTSNAVSLGLATVLFTPGSFGPWSLGTFFDYSGDVVTAATVSITNSLFASGTLVGGTASITKTAASLDVDLALIPIPASVLLFGSALMGLAVIRRDRKASTAA